MLAGLACLLVGWLFGGALGGWGTWLTIAGIALTLAAFVASVVMGAGSRSTLGGRHVEKRWRGQVIEYSEPSALERVRGWFRRKARR
jgi:hypothetical protein